MINNCRDLTNSKHKVVILKCMGLETLLLVCLYYLLGRYIEAGLTVPVDKRFTATPPQSDGERTLFF